MSTIRDTTNINMLTIVLIHGLKNSEIIQKFPDFSEYLRKKLDS